MRRSTRGTNVTQVGSKIRARVGYLVTSSTEPCGKADLARGSEGADAKHRGTVLFEALASPFWTAQMHSYIRFVYCAPVVTGQRLGIMDTEQINSNCQVRHSQSRGASGNATAQKQVKAQDAANQTAILPSRTLSILSCVLSSETFGGRGGGGKQNPGTLPSMSLLKFPQSRRKRRQSASRT
jgi:hypothetical protein